jgi:predicted ribonuclease YlaK
MRVPLKGGESIMEEIDRLTYVIDTNVLVDYPDIIQLNGSKMIPEEPTICLDGAHLVIPTAVIRELSSFKKEKSERGIAARIVLRKVRKIVEESTRPMGDVYNLKAPVSIAHGKQILSILPVHADFEKALPFQPAENDMDGQIILAALSVAFLKAGIKTDGTAKPSDFMPLLRDDVILLTNDNGLAIRARERGIVTSRYGYKYPESYTGRRDLVVPVDMLMTFYNERMIRREDFEKWMPLERKLIANEFIVMNLSDKVDHPMDYDSSMYPYFQNIGRYDYGEDAIVPLRYVSSFPIAIKNSGQAMYAEALMNPDFSAVICTGPAGSGKTYMATVYGYEACKAGEYIGVTMVPCEDHSNIGALPGDLTEKMDPDIQIVKNALRNYLLSEDSKLRKELDCLKKFGPGCKSSKSQDDPDDEASSKRSIKAKLKDRVDMIWDNWFSSIPVQKARGRDFSHELAFYDEFQDQNVAQADTLLKRIGNHGKIIVAGDLEQLRAPYLDKMNNGLVYASQLLFDDPMVIQVHFNEDEVIRHPMVRLIALRQKAKNLSRNRKEET